MIPLLADLSENLPKLVDGVGSGSFQRIVREHHEVTVCAAGRVGPYVAEFQLVAAVVVLSISPLVSMARTFPCLVIARKSG